MNATLNNHEKMKDEYYYNISNTGVANCNPSD